MVSTIAPPSLVHTHGLYYGPSTPWYTPMASAVAPPSLLDTHGLYYSLTIPYNNFKYASIKFLFFFSLIISWPYLENKLYKAIMAYRLRN